MSVQKSYPQIYVVIYLKAEFMPNRTVLLNQQLLDEQHLMKSPQYLELKPCLLFQAVIDTASSLIR
jgi:hypothetical protein